jgi:hypothetical protein
MFLGRALPCVCLRAMDWRLLLRFLNFLCLLHDKRFRASELFLSTLRKIVWPVLEQNDKAKSQNDKQDEPK